VKYWYTWEILKALLVSEFTKLHMGLVVLVKKNLPKFCWSCLTGLTHFANSACIQALLHSAMLHKYADLICLLVHIFLWHFNQNWCIYIYISFKVTLRSSGTDILYGCHLLLDVCIIYFISCDCIMNNSSLSYPIY
jgi:hypothetical protein